MELWRSWIGELAAVFAATALGVAVRGAFRVGMFLREMKHLRESMEQLDEKVTINHASTQRSLGKVHDRINDELRDISDIKADVGRIRGWHEAERNIKG